MKKGFIEDQFWTVVLLVIVIVFAILVFVISLWFKLFNGSLSYSIRFVELVDKPYMATSALIEARAGDRQLLEKIIESSVAGLSGGQADDLEADIRAVLDRYRLPYYSVTVTRGSDVVLKFDNLPKRCGASQGGFCEVDFDTGAGICNVNRVPIGGTCSHDEVCCREATEAEYATYLRDAIAHGKKYVQYQVVHCGDYSRGVCSQTYVDYDGAEIGCATGRKTVDDSLCRRVNDGNTPRCCVPIEPDTESTLGTTQAASVPLLFRDGTSGEFILRTG